MKMRGIARLLLIMALSLTLMLQGCVPADTPNENESTPSSEGSTPLETPESGPVHDPNDPFWKYQSNIVYGTGNNSMILSQNGDQPEIATYRAVFEVQEAGEFEYSLYFSNNIDSCSNANKTYRDMPTAEYEILYAAFRTAKDIKGTEKISKATEITFDGSKTKTVAPKEMFWSDPITYEVGKKEYLIFEWTVKFTKIPGTIIASTYYSYKSHLYGDERPYLMDQATGIAPMPDLIGCTRNNETRIAFIGDSITMGTGSGAYKNAFWVKQITDRIGDGYSVWNLGLDSARADDVISGTSFKEKIKHTDVLSICMGINDIAAGVYGKGGASDMKVFASISQIAQIAEEAGAEVIIFSIPPFNLKGVQRSYWSSANMMLKEFAEEKGYAFFDFAAVLGDPDDPSKCIYGDHPNIDGCTAVADAFMAANIIETKFKD